MVIISIFLSYAGLVHYKMQRSLKRELEDEIELIIILGASVKDSLITPILKSRLEKGAKLLQNNPDLKVIVTGGNGSVLLKSEAELMKDFLMTEYGIESFRIQIEDQSKNTYENLVYSKPLIEGKKCAIITSEFHSLRTALLSKRTGINSQVLGAYTPKNKRFKMEIREHLALIKSYFFDTY